MQNQNDASQGAKRPYFKHPLLWILLLMMVPFCMFLVWRIAIGMEISKKLDRLAASGLPRSGVELDRYYTNVPDTNNAALLLSKAFTQYQLLEGKKSNQLDKIVFLRDETLSDDERDLVEEHVLLNKNTIQTVKEALQLSQCRYPLDLKMGVFTPFPHLAPLKKLAFLLRSKARLDAETTNTSELLQDYRMQSMLSHTLDNEPLLMSQLVSISIRILAASEMQYTLSHCTFTDAELITLSQSFEEPQPNRMALGLIGERATTLPSFRYSIHQLKTLSNIGEDSQDSSYRQESFISKLNPPTSFLGLSGFFERDLNFYLDTMESCIEYSQRPPPQNLEGTNIFTDRSMMARQRYYVISAMMLPPLTGAITKETRTIAQTRLVRTALALERYRLAHHSLPDSLQQLVPQYLPAVPQDPFDGKPLRFKHTEKGYVVYSIGSDGIDHGGKEHITPSIAKKKGVKVKSDETYDLTFIVEH